jgi:GNAT superfamily N-acetyltransferase
VSAEITVRRLEQSDRDSWQPLWEAYLRFYRAELPADVSERTFGRLTDADGALVGLLALDADSRALGFAHLVFHASTWTKAPYCYLEDLFVAPAGRGSGAAKRLIEAVYETARARGAGRVYWTTQQFNGPARSLYDTLADLTSFVVYEHEL